MKKKLKLNEFHLEQIRKAAESNKTMPKTTPEEFKKQAQMLRDYRIEQDRLRRTNPSYSEHA